MMNHESRLVGSMVRLTDFRLLSFDCYGTLIDWETGLLTALRPLIERAGTDVGDATILESFAGYESPQEARTPAALYSDVLREVYETMATAWDVTVEPRESQAFRASVGSWPAFPDSREALCYLKQHYALAILSNVDRKSFAGSNARLGVEFDFVFTAEDIGSYKPDPRNFEHMLRELGAAGFAKTDILHTAQSLFHDHVPANQAGLASAWINRRHGRDGGGATPRPDPMPRFDFEFQSLAAMADAHRADRGLPHV